MVEPLSVALHAVRSAQAGPADVVVVLGLGSIGLNVVQMARALGAGRIVGVDISPARLKLASRGGRRHRRNRPQCSGGGREDHGCRRLRGRCPG